MTRSKPLIGGALLAVAFAVAFAVSGAYVLTGTLAPAGPAITDTPRAALARAERCARIRASVVDAGFADSVGVTCDDRQARLASDVYPDHPMMTGIVASNEQVPVPAARHAAPVALEPVMEGTPRTRDAALAVAVNGVPIFDYTGGGEMSVHDLHHHQTRDDTILTGQLDICGGHAGRGDDYHYHATPTCMIEAMPNAGDAAIIGWAFDGYPVYGMRNPDGTAIPPGTLDVCNGQPDAEFGHRYHTSEGAPYIVQCLMGAVPAMRDLPRVPPLRAAAGSDAKTVGRPPRGGVENLTFTEGPGGARSMEYVHGGEAYHIRYRPADAPGCYVFETRTVTDGGTVETGEHCR